jgi:hypothetical protein
LNTSFREDVTERLVTDIWHSLLTAGCKLKTSSGQGLTVIYPGKTSDKPGSDFQDAVIKIDRQIIKGNIEVHVKSSDWRKHGHHQNPAYNNIVLHVVMQQDCQSDTELQNGEVIPTVALDRYLNSNKYTPAFGIIPCSRIGTYSVEKLLEILDMAGAIRFYEKATKFQNGMKNKDAGQCLYSGIMKALGYTSNTEPFLKLAERIPLFVLESTNHREMADGNNLDQQALLLGTAGFLPSQRLEVKHSQLTDCSYVNELEKTWQTVKRGDEMSLTDWQVFRVRPSNSPLRRIVGMNYLVLRYQGKGLLDELFDLVREVPLQKSHHYLEAGLMVSDNDYWSSHFDFFKQCRGLSKWLIGQSRAADIVINVLLPFIYAWGKDNGRTEIAEKALTLFRSYPSVETNTIERHMRIQFSLKNSQVNSTQRQQGLLHLYKKFCTQGRCQECEVVNNN